MAEKIGVNEIVDQAAIDQVKQTSEVLKELLNQFRQTAEGAKILNAAIAQAEGIKNTEAAIRKQKQALSELEKIKQKIVALQTQEAQQVAQAKAEAKSLLETNTKAAAVANAERNSLERAQKLILQYTNEKKKLNLATEEGRRLNEAYNKAIEKSNQFIMRNADAETKRAKNVGNYAQSLGGLFEGLDAKIKATDRSLQSTVRSMGQMAPEAAGLRKELDAMRSIQGNSQLQGASGPGVSTIAQIKAVEVEMQNLKRVGLENTVAYRDLGTAMTHLRGQAAAAASNRGGVGAMAQILREMPAFAFSAQTGFMAISNNLPALGDEFRRIKTETGSTKAAFKSLASQLFSFGSLLTVGVTLLTVYGGKIWDWIKGVTSANTAQKDLNKSVSEGNKNAIKEVTQLDVLYKTTQNTTLSIENRKKAVDKLQELYPSYFGNIRDEIILTGGAAKAYMELRNAIFASARARAIQATLEDRAAKRIESELELIADIDRYDKLSKTAGATTNTNYGKSELSQPQTTNKTAAENRALAEFQKREAIKRLAEFREASLKEDDLLLQQQEEYYSKSDKLEADRIHNKSPRTKADKTAKEQAESDRIIYESQLALMEERERKIAERTHQYNEDKKKLRMVTAEEMKTFEAAYQKDLLDIDLEYQQKHLEQQDEFIKEMDERVYKKATDDVKKQQEIDKAKLAALKRHLKEMQDYVKQSNDNAAKLNEAEFRRMLSRYQMLDEYVQGAMASQQAITDLMYEREMRQIDEKDKALEASYEMERQQIESRAMSQQQRERELANLEARREADRKRIEKERITAERKRAQFQKAIDIASIISGTAVAVVAALGSKPYTPLNIAMAAGVAATGAANLARVVATPLPAYKDGAGIPGRPEHKGGLAQVGEVGTELGILPDGKTFLTPGKPTLMNLPAKTKIIPHDQLMQEVYNAAIIRVAQLANQGPTTTDKMQEAMIDTFENMTDEMKGMRKDIKGLKVGINLHGDIGNFITMKKIVS